MSDRPIIFSGESVRAILAGQKTVTRRVIKPQPTLPHYDEWLHADGSVGAAFSGRGIVGGAAVDVRWCPYGKPGDRLWVRETFRETWDIDQTPVMEYQAGGTRIIAGQSVRHGAHRCTSVLPRWRPSIFMPRWASRITLEIVSVRVERVCEITEEDAIAEGVKFGTYRPNECRTCARVAFMDTWDALNAKRGFSWDSNPWVFVVEFKRAAKGEV